jgi:hypothetical protein
VLLFGVLDVWAVWRSAPGLRWREGLVLAALVGFGLFPRWPLRVHGFDGERHAHLKAALTSLEAAPVVCVQPVLVPHLGSSRRLVPFLKASCVDRPGAVALLHPELAPSPWRRSDLEQLQARRPSEVLPGGFVVVRALPK